MSDSLPGNPGSDWTEQDARDVEHAMRFVEEFFGDKRCSLNAKYATALRREILRLRAELALKPTQPPQLEQWIERKTGCLLGETSLAELDAIVAKIRAAARFIGREDKTNG